jgi:hypothetical protein
MGFLSPTVEFLLAPLTSAGVYGLLILVQPLGYGWQHALGFV